MLKYNKGEWSEIYVLFRLLSDGFLETCDEKLNKIPNCEHKVLAVNMLSSNLIFELDLEQENVLIKTKESNLIALEPCSKFEYMARYRCCCI